MGMEEALFFFCLFLSCHRPHTGLQNGPISRLKKQHLGLSRGVEGADPSSMVRSISPLGDGAFYKMTTYLLHHLSTSLHSMRPEVLGLRFT